MSMVNPLIRVLDKLASAPKTAFKTASAWKRFFSYIVAMEQEFIAWLEKRIAKSSSSPEVILGVGDDGAILKGSLSKQVMVADTIVEDVHFELPQHRLTDIGHKALAINLSDIAAMGARGESALICFALPRSFSLEDTQELFGGILTSAQRYGVAVIGGDTTCHDGPLVVSVSASGRIFDSATCPEGWRMDGAKVDDLLIVTGPLGGSILGHHLRFEPRLDIAAAIQSRTIVNAATDLSDSLTVDLAHVIRKSGVGAVLDCDQVPVSDAAVELSGQTGKTPLHHAFTDGEDFELLLSMTADDYERLQSDASFDISLTVIGRCVSEHPGHITDTKSGNVIAIKGYEHG